MNNDEYVVFLRVVLVKIENALNFIEQESSKHILSYHKMLGVQQKLASLSNDDRNKIFPQLINVRGIINYFINGHYDNVHTQILKLKNDLVIICLEIQNETDRIEKI